MADTNDRIFCPKCGKALAITEFYNSNNIEKYPNKKLNQCKKCLTMHVDNWNPDSYLWILQEADVPYIPDEWNKLMATYAKDASKVTGTTIIGRYLAKMQLKQWRDFRWKDNEFLQDLANSKIEQAMKDQGYQPTEIATVLNQASYQFPTGPLEPPPATFGTSDPLIPSSPDEFAVDDEESELINSITAEEHTYLRLKWGKTYKAEEWIRLEQLYEEMMQSYEIEEAGDINTLKLACKCSLKANQLLDLGDIDGAQKATKMYNDLMKSGKWTAAQKKESEEVDVVDSIGELVAICERDGFIPKYYVATPQDHADRVIEDLKKYTTNLIVEESGLGPLIEAAVKQMEEEKERIKIAAEQSEEETEDDLFDYDKAEDNPIDVEDYSEFSEFQNKLEIDDNEFLMSLLDEREGDN